MDDFHLDHHLAFALCGVGMIIIESTAVLPEGCISPYGIDLYNDEHIAPLKRAADAIKAQSAVVEIHHAHADMSLPFAGYRVVPDAEMTGPATLSLSPPFHSTDKHVQPAPQNDKGADQAPDPAVGEWRDLCWQKSALRRPCSAAPTGKLIMLR